MLPKFHDRPGVCVYECLRVYLDRTKELRKDEKYLFISIRKPFVAVGSQTSAPYQHHEQLARL